MVDLKRLGHLLALAEERHFARAAERVHLSQPAFSRSIQAIEREAGMRLFDREKGTVRPTPAGEFLIRRAQGLLFEARNLQRDVGLYRESRLGDTAFGVGPFPAATLVPAAIVELRREHPDVGIRVEVSNWQLLLERLLAEDIEFFVSDVRDIPHDPRVHIASIGRQHGHCYVRAKHPLAGRRCTLAQAWKHGVASTRLPAQVKAALGRLMGLPPGKLPTMAFECDDVALLRTLAMSSDTVLASTDAAVAADVAAGRLVRLSIRSWPPIASEMGIVSLAGRTPSPMALRAMQRLREIAKTLG